MLFGLVGLLNIVYDKQPKILFSVETPGGGELMGKRQDIDNSVGISYNTCSDKLKSRKLSSYCLQFAHLPVGGLE